MSVTILIPRVPAHRLRVAVIASAAVLLGVYLMKKLRGRVKPRAGIVDVTSTVDAPISLYTPPISVDMRPNDAALAAAAAAESQPQLSDEGNGQQGNALSVPSA